MIPKRRPPTSKNWAYAYQLDPPQPELRFAKLKALLRRARLAARRNGRLWTGQIVMEAQITHILVVTDAPDEIRAVNGAIDAELKRLKMGFVITPPAKVSLSGVTPARRAAKAAARSG